MCPEPQGLSAPGGARAGARRGSSPAAPEGGGGPSGAGAAPLAREAFAGRGWARGAAPGGGQRPRGEGSGPGAGGRRGMPAPS